MNPVPFKTKHVHLALLEASAIGVDCDSSRVKCPEKRACFGDFEGGLGFGGRAVDFDTRQIGGGAEKLLDLLPKTDPMTEPGRGACSGDAPAGRKSFDPPESIPLLPPVDGLVSQQTAAPPIFNSA